MLALLPLFLQVMPELFKLGKSVPVVIDYIKAVRADFQQKGEWDQAAEDAFTAELQQLKDNPPDWWKPEHGE